MNESTERERRRYALLQAAAVIYAGNYEPSDKDEPDSDSEIPRKIVDEVELLMAEIEKREKP